MSRSESPPSASLSKRKMRKSSSKNDEDESSSESASASASISIKQWDPQTPYIAALKAESNAEKKYSVYLEQRSNGGNESSPAFYMDCSDYFYKQGERRLGLRILSNIAELELENSNLLRIMAYKLETEKHLDLAVQTFEKVLKLRPEEPQSYRDLALVLDTKQEYGRAMDLLWKVVAGQWDGRFDEIELIALVELNRIIGIIERNGDGEKWENLKKAIPVEKRFIRLMQEDLRIVLAWDQDMVDIDLHVMDPWGEDWFEFYSSYC